uniref:Uncharacterized protein n=1 Tax=Panagrolaimus davidi TaxID=227884 RepID=A0A914P8D4_9BILA
MSSSPPPSYSTRPNSSATDKYGIPIDCRTYLDNVGLPAVTLPGAIYAAPEIISISPVDPGYYNTPTNVNSVITVTQPEHFPRLREGDLITPDGGRHFVRRDGRVEYLTKQKFGDRRKFKWIITCICIILLIIIFFLAIYVPNKMKADKAAYATEHHKENEEKIKKQAEEAVKSAMANMSISTVSK